MGIMGMAFATLALPFLLISIFIAVAIFFLLISFIIYIFHGCLPSFVRESTMFNKASVLASDVAWMFDVLISYCLIPNHHYHYTGHHGNISNILRQTLGDMGWKHASSTDAVHECSVCLYNVAEGEEIGDLTCRHVFHRFCLETWVKYGNLTCPLCRGSLTAAGLNGELADHHGTFVINILSRRSHHAWR